MRKIFCVFLFSIIICAYIAAVALGQSNDVKLNHTNFSKKELLQDLAFSERQTFNKTYSSDSLTERLERLELEVLGAIQGGEEYFRIKNLKKSVTNVASGGNGLNYLSKTFNLAGNDSGNNSWVIGNMHNPYYNSYTPKGNSHRLPMPQKNFSHRLPPPNIPPHFHENYNNNPITNGNFSKNYSIGTSIKILDD